jgi:hypothetical protein
MPVPDFSPGEVLTAAAMDSIGLWEIATVTATSGTTVNITNLFSSDFANYRVVISAFRVASLAAGLSIQLGTGTAVNSAYYWAGTYLSAYSASPSLTSHGAANTASIETNIVSNASTDGGGAIELYSPNLARQTNFSSIGVDGRTDGAPRLAYSGFHNGTTQFTSLHITSGVTISNMVIRVYGYRN